MIPLPLNQHHQDAWDLLVVKASADTFLEDAPDAMTRARLLAAAAIQGSLVCAYV